MTMAEKLAVHTEIEEANNKRWHPKTIRYSPRGLGYDVWMPEAVLPDIWFSDLDELREFAEELGFKLKMI